MTNTQSAVQNSTDRSSISKMLMQLFGHWAISTEDQLDMLGLARDNRAALARYRKGVPMSASRDATERAGHLLAIHKNLRLLFPHNRDLAYKWMSTRNNAFEGRTPVDVVKDYGFAGLLMVRSYLDRMRGQ
ncbi:MAG: MbcA/ParS/Xre antitoxin family protein [Gallionella sp.]